MGRMRASAWSRLSAALAVGALIGMLAGRGPRTLTGQVGTDPGPGVDLARDLETHAVDLTYAFDAETIYWPTDESFRRQEVHWGRAPGGYWYASATYAASEHGGTHLDSPIHFGEGQATTEAIPLTRLIGPAAVVDVARACAGDRDYLVTVEDLEGWERAHGRLAEGSIVLIRTGWGRFWPDRKAYLGTDTPGDVANLHFPGLSREAAGRLVERKVAGVGVDTASLDRGPSRDFLAHRVLNGAGVYGLENVANLDRLPEVGATLIALPMKIRGGTGGPTRIIAILP